MSRQDDERSALMTGSPSHSYHAPQVVTAVPSVTSELDRKAAIQKHLDGANIYTILVGLWVGVLLASLDGSIVATIYPKIGTEFHRSNDVIWVATSYMLSFTALQPLYGRLSDAFGRKSTLQFCVVVFFIGSLMCGLSGDLVTLVVSRTIAGIGGGGLNTMSAVITSDLVTLRERGKYQGYSNIFYGVGAIVGAPLGGVLTTLVGWRYCFFLNIPFLLISIYIATWKLTDYNLMEEGNSAHSKRDRIRTIDYMGAVLIVGGVFCFMVATSMGGNTRAWTDPLVVGLLAGFVTLLLAFLFVEKNVARLPLMPWYIITERTPLTTSLVNFCGCVCSFASTFIIPLFYQALLDYTPSQAGFMFLPKVIGASVGSLYAGAYMNRTGEYKHYLTFSGCLQLVAMLSYTSWTPLTPTWIMYPVLVADGFSTGSFLTAAMSSILSCVEQKDMATVTSISYLFRSTGSVIGLCGSQAIFNGVVKYLLTERIQGDNAVEIIDIARRSMMEIRHLLPPETLAVVLETYEIAIRAAFSFCALFAALNVLATFFIHQHSLKK